MANDVLLDCKHAFIQEVLLHCTLPVWVLLQMCEVFLKNGKVNKMKKQIITSRAFDFWHWVRRVIQDVIRDNEAHQPALISQNLVKQSLALRDRLFAIIPPMCYFTYEIMELSSWLCQNLALGNNLHLISLWFLVGLECVSAKNCPSVCFGGSFWLQ